MTFKFAQRQSIIIISLYLLSFTFTFMCFVDFKKKKKNLKQNSKIVMLFLFLIFVEIWIRETRCPVFYGKVQYFIIKARRPRNRLKIMNISRILKYLTSMSLKENF